MPYTPLSPFKRPMTRAHLRVIANDDPRTPADPVSGPATSHATGPAAVDKWQVLRNLATARPVLGLSDRDLAVLQALLSFHPATALQADDTLVVYASNRAICERLNAMPCSTMRRHLARLIDAGLLARRDSPNGKRYARAGHDGPVAYGLDLGPLVARAASIARLAQEQRALDARIKALREEISLMRRDAFALADLADLGGETGPAPGLRDELRDRAALTARALRRKLGLDELQALAADLAPLLHRATDAMRSLETADPGTRDHRIEQHNQRSDEDSLERSCAEQPARPETARPDARRHDPGDRARTTKQADPADTKVPTDQAIRAETPTGHPRPIPLSLVIQACPSLSTLVPDPIRRWHDLCVAAGRLAPALGISPSAWSQAQRVMGPEAAAAVLAALLERFGEIRSPGGYLRALTVKAAHGDFSCHAMLRSLQTRQGAA